MSITVPAEEAEEFNTAAWHLGQSWVSAHQEPTIGKNRQQDERDIIQRVIRTTGENALKEETTTKHLTLSHSLLWFLRAVLVFALISLLMKQCSVYYPEGQQCSWLNREAGMDVCARVCVWGALGFVYVVLRQLETMMGEHNNIFHAWSECISAHSAQHHRYTNISVNKYVLVSTECEITPSSVLYDVLYSVPFNNKATDSDEVFTRLWNALMETKLNVITCHSCIRGFSDVM